LKNLAHFWQPKRSMLKHHIHHAKHHNVTTKTPREKGVFLEKPQQKRPSPH
jgi:hypothetical protein